MSSVNFDYSHFITKITFIPQPMKLLEVEALQQKTYLEGAHEGEVCDNF